ncbi:MAG: TaqI-like C-terminal specificity domain-containing protein, partial [Longimicrobiales bacterium]|nr:TaqI-like C-terminal specificity domain-containing protein [Longimicrobiales bacterium]
VGAHVRRLAISVPASQFHAGGARLARATDADRKARMEASGPRLGEVVGGQIFRGVLTGLNEAFIVDQATRDALVGRDPRSAEILKPLLVGDDVRRYEVHFRERYLIFTRRGIRIADYPAILRHLERWREGLTPKRTGNEAHGRKPGDYEWYEIQDTVAYYAAFDAPKIVYPEIAKETRFTLDSDRYYPIKTIFSIPADDPYIVAVLNSQVAWDYLRSICSVLGDEDAKGRLTQQEIYLERVPIPEAPAGERAALAALAQRAQGLHGRRRTRAEAFLAAVGLSPAGLSSRNPLEEPWSLSPEEFARRCRGADLGVWRSAREETTTLTEQIALVEGEVDRHVAALYGVG